MSKSKISFTVDVDGEVLDLCVVKPTAAVLQESQRVWNKAFNDAISSKAILGKKLEQLLEEQGIWNEEKQKEYDALLKNVSDKETALKKGGVSKAQGRKMALELRKLREEASEFRSQRNYLSNSTVESSSDNARFNYFIYACTKWNSGDKAGQNYFDSFQEYEESESSVGAEAGIKLMELMYDWDENSQLKLPENQFLIKYGFANEKGQLVNKNGEVVDEDGRLVDSENNWIDVSGHKVNKFGNPVDLNIDDAEFTD